MGKVRMAKSNLDVSRVVGVVEHAGIEYSQYHQGAGEDATLDLMRILQDVPKTSLVLIDEVEASSPIRVRNGGFTFFSG